MTRRAWSTLPPTLIFALAAAALACAGCSEEPPRVRGQLAEQNFDIGSPEDFRAPGIYQQFRDSHGVWICSDGRFMVVLTSTCPYDDHATHVAELTQQYRCARCGARFSDMGLPLSGGGIAENPRSLRRLRLEPQGERAAPGSTLLVNPRVTYAFENNEWSSRFSLFMFDPRE